MGKRGVLSTAPKSLYLQIHIHSIFCASDIAFVRTWYPVAIPHLYNPVTTLLLPPTEKEQWLGMKTVGQLRREAGIRRNVNEDHLYKVKDL